MDLEQYSLDREASWSETISTPIGLLTLTAQKESLISLSWETVKRKSPFCSQKWKSSQLNDKSKKVIKLSIAQLKEYFDGKRINFEIPIQPMGTDFQKKAWNELRHIAYGEVISYGEQAKRMGNPNSARAVGGANGKNPIGIIIPCHRVIGSTGALVGFTGGLKIKTYLLNLESKVSDKMK